MPDQKNDRFKLPGFGVPVDLGPGHPCPLFPSAIDPEAELFSMPLTTLREFAMLGFMDEITDKPDWDIKVFNEQIVSRWREEALSTEIYNLSPACLEWAIEELRYKAGVFRETGAVTTYNGDVVKSDTAITDALKESLKAAVLPLESVPEMERDYHPRSNGQVVDLVHPSLFPLIYGRSRILPDKLIGLEDCLENTGLGQTISIPPESTWPTYSQKFQWLPCEVEFEGSADAGSKGMAKITSYINNLHPKRYRDLYVVIEQIISRTIPLWNMTLAPIVDKNIYPIRIPFKKVFYDPDLSFAEERELFPQGSSEDSDEYMERYSEWKEDFKVEHVVIPEPGGFQKPEASQADGFDLRERYGHRGLQIIVKLASIYLTPDKPEYEGGSWHVEGQMNEHICATALYYYDNHNVTKSQLAFRQHASNEATFDFEYEQNDFAWLFPIFGLGQEGPTVQKAGQVLCREGRLLTFPNILQHQVQPFKLEDDSKSGHRKILALFLVDPNVRIISTANVPPQQRDWWKDEVLSTGVFNQLAAELQDQTFAVVDDFPIGLDEAKQLRLELMDERKEFVVQNEKDLFSFEVNLCEH